MTSGWTTYPDRDETRIRDELYVAWRWEITLQQRHAIVQYITSSQTFQSTWCNWALFAGKWARGRQEVLSFIVVWDDEGTNQRLMLMFREGNNYQIFYLFLSAHIAETPSSPEPTPVLWAIHFVLMTDVICTTWARSPRGHYRQSWVNIWAVREGRAENGCLERMRGVHLDKKRRSDWTADSQCLFKKNKHLNSIKMIKKNDLVEVIYIYLLQYSPLVLYTLRHQIL